MRLLRYDVVINNYEKGALLKTAMLDHVVKIEQIDSHHHRVTYELENTKQRDFIAKVFNRKLRPIGWKTV